MCGANSDIEAFNLYSVSKCIFKEGGFNLRKFITNSMQLRNKIVECEKRLQENPPKDDAESYTQTILGNSHDIDDSEQKILGVRWNFMSDEFIFDLSHIVNQTRGIIPKKRNIVGVASKIFDPLGILTPITIRFKMLFKELCEAKTDWDDPLPPVLLKKWNVLINSLCEAKLVIIPRWYFKDVDYSSMICRLQGFSDASKAAYAAVVYLSIEVGTHKVNKLIGSKSRVSPMKELTIPRLELLGALLLANLMKTISQALENELSLKTPCYFTDSQATLYWIKGQNKTWKPFVQTRVNKIRSLSCINNWRYCPGDGNPADIPSRGCEPNQLMENPTWLNGPQWLLSGENYYKEVIVSMPEECQLEQKGEDTSSLFIQESVINTSLIDIERFSSLQKLLRVTASKVHQFNPA